MTNYVVLCDRTLIKLSLISSSANYDSSDDSIMYFSSRKHRGKVMRFKYGANYYLAIFDISSGDFIGYYNEEYFWANNTSRRSNNIGAISKLDDAYKFIPPSTLTYLSDSDNVYMVWETVNRISGTLTKYTNFKKITFANLKALEAQLGRTVANSDELTSFDSNGVSDIEIHSSIDEYYQKIVARKYLSIHGSLYSLSEKNIDVLYDIAAILNHFKKINISTWLTNNNIPDVFQYHMDITTRYSFTNGSIYLPYHKVYNEELFARLRLGLIDFKYYLTSFDNDYSRLDRGKLLLYLVNIFPEAELSSFPYSVKISLLLDILKSNFWIRGNWFFNELNDERLIIKLIKSIGQYDANSVITNIADIDCFFQELEGKFDGDKTLFEVLYYAIDNGLKDTKEGNKTLLINAIKELWIHSSFNPSHANETIAEAAIRRYQYTQNTGANASPLFLNYESDKMLLWYVDNFKFKFNGAKIEAYKETLIDSPEYITGDKFDRYAQSDASGKTTTYLLYGTYSLFQPVVIISNQLDAIIQFPVTPLKPGENSNLNERLKATFPVFELKYIDDAGDNNDFKETLGVIADVAITFTGVGNLTKLKYIRHISKVARAAELAETEIVLTYKAVVGLSAALEITAGLVSTTSNYYHQITNTQESLVWQSFMVALDIASLSFDSLAKRSMQNKARTINQYYTTNGGWPNNVPNDVRNFILEIANVADIVTDGITRIKAISVPVGNYIQALSDVGYKLDFITDFADNATAIKQMEANIAVYYSNWAALRTVNMPDRKIVEVLASTTLTNNLATFYGNAQFKAILNKATHTDRMTLFNHAVINDLLNSTRLSKLQVMPEKLELALEWVKKHSVPNGSPRQLLKSDILQFIDSNLSSTHIKFQTIRLGADYKKALSLFRKQTGYTIIDSQKMIGMYNGSYYTSLPNLSGKRLRRFKGTNKLNVSIQPILNNNPAAAITEKYLSGENVDVVYILGNTLSGFTEPTDLELFRLFTRKAFATKVRENDTEVKFIFNFLTNHWHKGDKFVISIDSTIYPCASCQNFLVYLSELARQEDKIIELNVVGDKRVTGVKKIEEHY